MHCDDPGAVRPKLKWAGLIPKDVPSMPENENATAEELLQGVSNLSSPCDEELVSFAPGMDL